jgi:hypothetical protein
MLRFPSQHGDAVSTIVRRTCLLLAVSAAAVLAATGGRLEIDAGKEPLWPQAFDPWNVVILGDKEVPHTRWLKLGNGSGAVEVLGRSASTETAGAHPLFSGVRQLIVTGLTDPKVSQTNGKVTLETSGVKATFSGSIERELNLIRIRLP